MASIVIIKVEAYCKLIVGELVLIKQDHDPVSL